MSATNTAAYPLSPPTSSGYTTEEVLAGEYSKYGMPLSFFHGEPAPGRCHTNSTYGRQESTLSHSTNF